MKKYVRIILFFPLFLLGVTTTSGQSSFLSLDYKKVEKSKDSHSILESFSMKENMLFYAIKYTGRRGPGQKDLTKTCRLSATDVLSVHELVREKNLAVTDSLLFATPDSDGMAVTSSLNMTYTTSRVRGKIRIMGKPSLLEKQPLYERVFSLLDLLRKLVKKCP